MSRHSPFTVSRKTVAQAECPSASSRVYIGRSYPFEQSQECWSSNPARGVQRGHPLASLGFILWSNRPGEATDGWPSGYGASFRILFQSLVFGRGFEPHSIQSLGASVLPVLAVFPFCLSVSHVFRLSEPGPYMMSA